MRQLIVSAVVLVGSVVILGCTEEPALEPPIQNLAAFDVLGVRNDGGIDAAIVAATRIDGSRETLRALTIKVRNYATELSSQEFLAKHPDAAGRIRIVIYAHGAVDPRAERLIHSLATEVSNVGIKLETEAAPPNKSLERTREG